MSVLVALLSSVFVGLSDFTAGFVGKRVHPLTVVGGGAVVSTLLILGYGVASQQLSFDKVDVVSGVIAGALLLIGTFCYVVALAQGGHMGVTSATTTLLVLVPIIFDIRNQQMPSALTLVGIGVTIGGVILLNVPDMKEGKSSLKPVFLALLAALAYGVEQVVLDTGSQDNITGTLLTVYLFQLLLCIVIAAFARSLGGLSRNDLPLIGLIGLTGALGIAAFSWASTAGDVAVVSMLASLDPIVIVLLALFLLREKLVRIQVIAIVVVIAGSFLVAAGGSTRQRAHLVEGISPATVSTAHTTAMA